MRSSAANLSSYCARPHEGILRVDELSRKGRTIRLEAWRIESTTFNTIGRRGGGDTVSGRYRVREKGLNEELLSTAEIGKNE